ncbi:outer membrane beta-barrel protein [Candidatus Palauibacter sp.]|uniref:outer membrane beta-barrel protein n=1 Tax=Candidatus Palauibacter sp. TaxID=3101350 RepID=UPI003B591AD2
MKKTLVVTLLTTLAAAPLAAQTTIGLRGGISNATLSGVMSVDGSQVEKGSRFGAVSGIDVGIPLGGILDVRIGLGLAQKGGSTDAPRSITAGRSFLDVTAELDYLQFSTLLRASTEAERGLLRLGVLAGPYMALNHSCDVAVAINRPPPGSGFARLFGIRQDLGTSCIEAEGTDFRSTDFGLAFGAGVEVKLSDSLALAFDMIYAMGLSSIDDDGSRHRHLAVQSGLVFAIG